MKRGVELNIGFYRNIEEDTVRLLKEFQCRALHTQNSEEGFQEGA